MMKQRMRKETMEEIQIQSGVRWVEGNLCMKKGSMGVYKMNYFQTFM